MEFNIRCKEAEVTTKKRDRRSSVHWAQGRMKGFRGKKQRLENQL